MQTYLCTEEATWVSKHWQEKGVPMIYSVTDQLREVLSKSGLCTLMAVQNLVVFRETKLNEDRALEPLKLDSQPLSTP